MLEVRFGIQGEKTPLSRWLQWAIIAGLGLGIICLIVPQLRFLWPFPALVLSGALIYSIVVTVSGDALYQTTGHLLLGEQEVRIQGVETHKFRSEELQRVEVNFRSYRGQTNGRNVRDGSDNVISFHLVNDLPVVVTFLAESYGQSQLFIKILKSWRAAGIKVVADGIYLA